ncbi:MAG: GrpB family protein [Clostridiales bacterium]|nr:GrpB family protein [Clostridiales bacterium]
MARKIEIVDYQPEWEAQYREEAKRIKSVLGWNCTAIYHIGSTSVQALRAKPVIDILPVVKSLSAVDACQAELETLGYESMGEFGIPGRRFFRKGGDNRTHHIHIFDQKNTADISRHLAVRDYLRSHPRDAEAYATLKTELAGRFPYDNDGYCDGKADFMRELEKKALIWTKQQGHCPWGCAWG